MNFIWDYIGEDVGITLTNIIVDLVVVCVIYAILVFVFVKCIKRIAGYILLGSSFVSLVLCYILMLDLALILVAIVTACFITGMLFANMSELRTYMSNSFKRTVSKTNKNHVEKIFDRHATYQVIDSTVKALSRAKIGALLTFERTALLDDFCRNGVKVDAPISQELLMTIFYPGTRLHDGAVIIHGNTIKAAAVFFTPSTKAFTTKYGSRHRAAIGISEVSDSVTVVVSEETGRISFAINGQIETVSPENFLRVFENYMIDYESENESFE